MTKHIPTTKAGFSLLEFLVATVITGIALASFASVVPNALQLENKMGSLTSLLASGAHTSYDLSEILKSVGGNQLPVWQSVIVENNCANRGPLPNCQGSDRLNVLELLFDTNTNLVLTPLPIKAPGYVALTGVLQVDPTGGCPLNAKYLNTNLAMINGTTLLVVWASSMDPVACTIQTTQSLQGTIFNNYNPASGVTFVGQSALGVMAKTYYWDMTKNTLVRYIDVNNSNVASPQSLTTEYYQIYDFQVSLGYYSPTANNNGDFNGQSYMHDSADENDVWLYNSSRDVWGAGGLRFAQPADLKMIGFQMAVGSTQNVSSSIGGGSFQLYDGPNRTYPKGQLTQVLSRKLYFRNEAVFVN